MATLNPTLHRAPASPVRSIQPYSFVPVLLAGWLLAAGLAISTSAVADDRDLLRDSSGQPYVFILFDVSGSMNWSPKCTAEQLNPPPLTDENGNVILDGAGNPIFPPPECDFLCPTGDCFVPRQADDPNAKFYQAKEALYEVLKDIDDVAFGFATYNQDNLRVKNKHWLYRPLGGVNIPGFGTFPPAAASEVFGRRWLCDNGPGIEEIGCRGSDAADLFDDWERNRVLRLAKGGDGFNEVQDVYVRVGAERYRVRYRPSSGTLPDPLVDMELTLHRCNNFTCNSLSFLEEVVVSYALVDEFLSWDFIPGRGPQQLGYFDQGQAADALAGNTCAGWDPNTDSGVDDASGINLHFPTTFAGAVEPRRSLLSTGDVLPLSWTSTHKDEILHRLAPNTVFDPFAEPNFSIAPYFEDHPRDASALLRLRDPEQRPLLAFASTPLGNSIKSFREWYAGCPQGACPNAIGWSDIAGAEDPDWACRRKFLLVISDGDETCNGADACSGTAALRAQEGIRTFVVAFGVQNTPGNRLTCMASNGGTGEPVFPQNKQQLVDELNRILGEIRQEARAFASAAVPSVQAEVTDKIYLSSFTPLNGRSFWDGHLDAFLKPLPLTAGGRPDRGTPCDPGIDDSRCHLWDAGEVLLTQAPDALEVASGNFRLGSGADERRILYGEQKLVEGVPTRLGLFEPPEETPAVPIPNPSPPPAWFDLAMGMRIGFDQGDSASLLAARTALRNIVSEVLVEKTATVDDAILGTRDITYVLGDIFHSDPLIIDNPSNFLYFATDLFGDADPFTCPAGDASYRCFALEYQFRRKMLAVGANDGQLHFFDAGRFDPSPDEDRFDNGTGKELFSFMPRSVLPVVRAQATGVRQIFSVDGRTRVDDVFIDPVHNGTPNPDERQWRSVVLGGLREGGSIDKGGNVPGFVSAYYALDITQPDANPDARPPLVPDCLNATDPNNARCGSVPFPSLLWEFTDALLAGSDEIRLDEDENDAPDLGHTWSVPVISLVQVTVGGVVEPRFVAIFGGGVDPENKLSPQRGTWLYMVDIETGKAIYKRPLEGAAIADPTVVDENLDGFADQIYIGTTAGFLYKVDVSQPAALENRVLPVTAGFGVDLPNAVPQRTVPRIAASDWRPFPIFNTEGRSLYIPATALFLSDLNRFALTFGTGDREDLWNFNGEDGRFYLIVDTGFTYSQFDADGDGVRDADAVLPLVEGNFEVIGASDAPVSAAADFVLRPDTLAGKRSGWILTLDANERVTSKPFGLLGVLIFSTFQPQVVTFVDEPANPAPGGGPPAGPETVCARTGDTRIFVVFANNANPVASLEGLERFRIVKDVFVTPPFAEKSATKNPPDPNNPDDQIPETPDPIDQLMAQIRDQLKQFCPDSARFNNQSIDISAVRDDTGIERFASVPVCIVPKNWKEF